MSPHTLDLHYLGIPRAIAAFLIIGPGGPVLIETGPASTLQHLERGARALGFKLNDIKHALVTHIHLDHAGAAGHLAANGTRIYVHEFGAKHLIDPSRLVDSAARIYGSQMDRLWGRILPVPHQQITPVHDGDVIEICGFEITAIETPGHARHHHAFAIGDTCFTGDIAGISVPEIPEPPEGSFIAIPTPPPEFNLDAWRASIDRLLAKGFRRLYLTHFGARHNPVAHLERTKSLVGHHAAFVQAELAQGASRSEILARYVEWNRVNAEADGLRQLDFARYVSTNLLAMNVDGLIRYWAKRGADQSPAAA